MNSPFGTSLKKTDRTPARIIFRQDRLVPTVIAMLTYRQK